MDTLRDDGGRSEHVDTVVDEIEKLKEAIVITEVLYSSWLSNILMVKKKTASGESTLTSQALIGLV